MLIRSIAPGSRTFVSLLLVFGLLLHGIPCPAQEELVAEAPVSLSARSTDNQHPVVASSPDGHRVVAAWDGLVAESRRIFIRESVDGVWLPERIVDSEPLARNHSPAVAVDDSGNIHVAWLGRAGEDFRVFYASGIGGHFVSWGVLDGGEAAGENCGKLVLKLDATGSPWLAWESGRDTRFSIRVARLVNGRFVVRNLTPNAQNQNWFPELLLGESPMVAWYADKIPECEVQAARLDPASGEWEPVKLDGLEHLPKDALPQLVQWPGRKLTACWIEEISEPGSTRTDYVLLAGQSADPDMTPRPIDYETTGTKESLTRSIAAGRLVVAWCSKSFDEGWQIYVAAGEQAPFGMKARLSDGDRSGYYDSPSVAGLPDGVAAVWHSSESFGGDGRVLFRRLRFAHNN